jgi:hypothetical protein
MREKAVVQKQSEAKGQQFQCLWRMINGDPKAAMPVAAGGLKD